MSSGAEQSDERTCWICFITEEENKLAEWVQPCKCRGTAKWVHKNCLYYWVLEKKKGNALLPVSCHQCKTKYIIVMPHMANFANILEAIDNTVRRLCPGLAIGIIVGSLYWSVVTYGAIAVLETVGHEKGMALMEKVNPVVLVIVLPSILTGLVLGRIFPWELAVKSVIRSAKKFPLIRLIFPYSDENEEQKNPAPLIALDAMLVTRVFCGASLLPTISSIVGKILFATTENSLHRTLLGGITFITVKGIMKIYLKQQQNKRSKALEILDYTEENIRQYGE